MSITLSAACKKVNVCFVLVKFLISIFNLWLATIPIEAQILVC